MSGFKNVNLENFSSAGENDINVDFYDLDAQEKLSGLERYRSDTKDRKWLAEWAAAVVTMWLFSVLVILSFNSSCLKLSDSVIITLLGTTTLNVLGLIAIVLRGHFKESEKQK